MRNQSHSCPLPVRKPGAVFALLLPVAVLAAVLTFSVVSLQAGTAKPACAALEVVVMPGDTLWSIARKHVSERADLRAAVDDIMRLNGLADSMLRPGQVILVEVPLDDAGDGSRQLIASEEF